MSQELKQLLKELGAWYEQGAWRFPSVYAKERFIDRAAALGYSVE